MSKPVITVANLSKRYFIGHQRTRDDGLRHLLTDAMRAPLAWLRSNGSRNRRELEEYWALKDVSFEIQQGDVLGIIGRNGAGKSTLLKILSRITEPTSGRIEIEGRVASLLEVGTGFHPDLTGRENIFLNGAILGMSRVEIKRKFDEIVAFAEVAKFLDTPVKRYSSGMYVRLAFAVAAHLEPEILIIDEVLAVGDAAFQKKCLGKMHEVAREGRTVIFVSHNMHAVRRLCTRGIVFQEGRLLLSAPAPEAIDCYFSVLAEGGTSEKDGRNLDSVPEGEVRYVGWELKGSRLDAPHTCYARECCCFLFTLVCRRPIRGCQFGLSIKNNEDLIMLGGHSLDVTKDNFDLAPGIHVLEWQTRVPLPAGQYSLQVGVKSQRAFNL
jgi:homopolymeric O-antigen transport system ATP-binding protein